MRLHRRELLGSAALLLIGGATGARAQWLPWRPEAGSPPAPFVKGPWIFFDPAEGAAVEALVDRLIPPDPDTPGGKDAGCAVYHRSAACWSLWPPGRPLSQPAVHQRNEAAGPAGRRRACGAIPQGASGARPILQKGERRRVPVPQRRGQGRDHRRVGERRSQAGRRRRAGVFRALAEEYAGGIFRRSDLRRQSRHVLVADDRLSRRALRLPRLGQPP